MAKRRIQLKVTGADKLQVKFKDLENVDLTPALSQGCELIRKSAVLYCPADTGILRRSISVDVQEKVGSVYTNMLYAPYVEFGTGLFAANGDGRKDVPWRYQDDMGQWHSTIGQHPQPFMHPALEHNRENILRIFKAYFKEKIDD